MHAGAIRADLADLDQLGVDQVENEASQPIDRGSVPARSDTGEAPMPKG